MFRHHHPADPPAGHAEIFRERIDHERMGRQLRRRHRGERVVEAMKDFVRNESDSGAFRRRNQARQGLARHHRTSGIGGGSDQHSLQWGLAMGCQQGFTGQGMPGFAGCLDQHRFTAQRGENMAIWRIAGYGNCHPIAGLEHGEKAQDERTGGARGDHNPLGVHTATVVLAVGAGGGPGDARAQRGGSQRGSIVDPPAVECGMRGHYGRFRRRGRRLSHFHVNDVAAGRLNARGGRHHIHHHERRNVASPRCRQQALCTVSHCRFKHRYLLFDTAPQTGRIRRFARAYRLSDRPPIIKDCSMLLRIALRKKTSKFTAISAAITLALAPSALAQEKEKGPAILRDTESEQLLRDYTRPILRVAGLEKQNIQVTIINESVFNAFVADGHRIFVNYGALMQSETPNQIIGVLAHETGHLAGGHLSKLREQVAVAQTQMVLAMLLGVGAIATGAKSGSSTGGLANAGAAALSAPQEVITRNLISYQRQQEENADRAGVKFLTATGQSAKGMYDTFKRFSNDSLFAAHGADPYAQSHPMPAERVAALEEIAHTSPYWDKKDDSALQLRHDMMRAKISAFMERQDTVYRRYPLSNTSLPSRYAHAITTYLHGDLRNALAQIDGLIQLQPNNPYFYELRGQALLEGGKPAEAVAPL